MPIPFLIPILIAGVSAAGATKGGMDAYSANRKREESARRRKSAEARLEAGEGQQAVARQELEESFQAMVLAQTSGIALLGQVVDWLEKGSIESPEWATLEDRVKTDLADWRRNAVQAKSVIGDVVGAVSSSAGSRALATALATRIGVASTGAAISGLSGAAARNATLAWLGGGSLAAGGGGMALGSTVLTGLNVGVGIFAVGFAAKKAAIQYSACIDEFVDDVDAAVAQYESERKLWVVMMQRFDQVRRSVNGVGRATLRALEIGNPQDPKNFIAVVALGQSLSRLARLSPLDEGRELVKEWDSLFASACAVEFTATDAPLHEVTFTGDAAPKNR